MKYQELFNKALEIAFEAHKGQVDKGGEAYIMHCIRVSQGCKTPDAKIVALLHDIIEDTDTTVEYLSQNGIPAYIIREVELLTRDNRVGYLDYIKNISDSLIASEVKLADLKDNLDYTRLQKEKLDNNDDQRLKKYQKAYSYLIWNIKIKRRFL